MGVLDECRQRHGGEKRERRAAHVSLSGVCSPSYLSSLSLSLSHCFTGGPLLAPGGVGAPECTRGCTRDEYRRTMRGRRGDDTFELARASFVCLLTRSPRNHAGPRAIRHNGNDVDDDDSD